MIKLITYLLVLILTVTNFVYANPREATLASPIMINDSSKLEAVEFSRIVIRIPSSKDIGDIQANWICSKISDFTLNDNNFTPSDVFFADKFVEEFNNANYNIIGNQNDLFDDKSKKQARYVIAGMIVDMETDICFRDAYNQFTREKNKIKGAMYLKIDWQVLDTKNSSVVYKKTTEGYHNIKEGINNGYILMFERAYGGSIRNLLSNQDFHDLLLVKDEETIHPSYEDIIVNYQPVDNDTKKRELDTPEESVVGIKTLSGSGSGFIISPSGHILTNNHVVNGFDKVTVVFSNGMEIEGTVLRTAPERDVALIKTPLSNLNPVSLKPNLPKVGSKVYAMGAPQGLDLQGTLSSGIISAIRKNGDYDLIQSDTSITFGNSGGPMFNEDGQVIAISVSGRQDVDFANFFIPIDSALKKLNILHATH